MALIRSVDDHCSILAVSRWPLRDEQAERPVVLWDVCVTSLIWGERSFVVRTLKALIIAPVQNFPLSVQLP